MDFASPYVGGDEVEKKPRQYTKNTAAVVRAHRSGEHKVFERSAAATL